MLVSHVSLSNHVRLEPKQFLRLIPAIYCRWIQNDSPNHQHYYCLQTCPIAGAPHHEPLAPRERSMINLQDQNDTKTNNVKTTGYFTSPGTVTGFYGTTDFYPSVRICHLSRCFPLQLDGGPYATGKR